MTGLWSENASHPNVFGASQSFRRDPGATMMKIKWICLLPPLVFIQVSMLTVPTGSLAAQLRNSSKTAPEQVAALPSDVQQIVDEGILATRREDWAQAADRFEAVRKLAPAAPSVLLNLGLAESKIPGRELISIAWLRAYLCSMSNPPKSKTVLTQIADLEHRSKNLTNKLLQTAMDLTAQFPPEFDSQGLHNTASGASVHMPLMTYSSFKGSYFQGRWSGGQWNRRMIWNKNLAIFAIANIQTGLGDTDASRKIFERIRQDEQGPYKDRFLQYVALAEARKGDISEAIRTASRISDDVVLAEAYRWIVDKQISIGDIKAALQTASLIPESQGAYQRAEAYQSISNRALGQGDLESASQAASMAWDASKPLDQRERERYDLDSFKQYRLSNASQKLAKDKAEQGNFGTALQIAASLPESDDSWDHGYRKAVYEAIVRQQVGHRDFAGALQTMRLVPVAHRSPALYEVIAEGQAKSGELGAALQTVLLIEDFYTRSAAYSLIAMEQAKRGELAIALQTASMIADPSYKSEAYLMIAKQQATRGDVSAARQSEESCLEATALIHDLASRLVSYAALAEWQTERGDTLAAKHTASTALQDSQVAGDEHVYTLISIANSKTRLGDLEGAKLVEDLVLSKIAEAKDMLTRFNDYRALAPEQFERGDKEAAIRSERAAAPTGPFAEDPQFKSEAFLEIAKSQLKWGDMDGVLDSEASASAAASQIKDLVDKSRAYANLAEWQFERGDADAANRNQATALLIAATIEKPDDRIAVRDEMFQSIGGRQAVAGDWQAAITTSEYISGHQLKVTANRSLAEIARKSGNAKAEVYFSAEADRLNTRKEWANDKKLQAWTGFVFDYFRDPRYCADLRHGKCSIQPASSLFTDFSAYLQTIQTKTAPSSDPTIDESIHIPSTESVAEDKLTEIITGLETLVEGLSRITWIESEQP